MSNIELIIEERSADIGNFLVGRLLPFREKRMVGPFIFIDHMGPVELEPGQNMDVAPHPHIGLSTLTYLFEGNIMHRDSLGTEIEISPGQVNWMTAGSGIVHSERTPDYLRNVSKRIHGLQIWVAMPKELEQTAPSFHHVNEDELTHWEENGISFRLIAGNALGRKSPVPVHSNLFLLEIRSTTEQIIDLGGQLYGESGLYILEGSISQDEHKYGPKQILVAKEGSLCRFTIAANSAIFIFGGDVFPEERFIYWNFVASSQEIIEKAKQRWIDQQFDPVPGETTFVPLPPQNNAFKPKQS